MMKLLRTGEDTVFFEDTTVGRLKKELFDATDEEIDCVLGEYGVPSPSELGTEGCYIQSTIRKKVEDNRKKNDVVLIPVGSTENHGRHMCSASDTYFSTHICEGVRRYTAKQGRMVSLAMPPLLYGSHPSHHIGMPGTVPVSENAARDLLMDVMLGLWNDGFRKQIIVNNHGQLWMLESALQQFAKKYDLPGVFRVVDWPKVAREFFLTKDRGGHWETDFVHADEAETSVALLHFPEKVDMKYAVDTEPESYLPPGHFSPAADPIGRPSRWSEGAGHFPMEVNSIPEGVAGCSTLGDAQKAKRLVAAAMRYLTLLIDEILEAFPPGTVPPVDKVTLRDPKEMEPYLKEPLSPGWKPVYSLLRSV